jgi:SAM-dependent methyltransferase
MSEKFNFQDRQYRFPYHYIPHFDEHGIPSRMQFLPWGFEYLCYIQYVKNLVQSYAPLSLLDVGCGDGRLLGLLSKSGIKLCGVDPSVQAIGLARALRPDVDYRCTTAKEIAEQFDLVTAIEVLEHIPDDLISDFIVELCDKTRVDGRLIISVPTTILPTNKKHYRHYNKELLLDQIAHAPVDLELLELHYVFREDFFYKLFRRITYTRPWTLDCYWLNRLMWHHIWHKLREADADRGRHLVAVFCRKN